MKQLYLVFVAIILGSFAYSVSYEYNLADFLAQGRPLYRDGKVVGDTEAGESTEQLPASSSSNSDVGANHAAATGSSMSVSGSIVVTEMSSNSADSVISETSNASSEAISETSEASEESVSSVAEVPEPPVEPAEESGGMFNLLTLSIVGAVALLGSGLGFFFFRKRKGKSVVDELPVTTTQDKKAAKKKNKGKRLEDVLAEMEIADEAAKPKEEQAAPSAAPAEPKNETNPTPQVAKTSEAAEEPKADKKEPPKVTDDSEQTTLEKALNSDDATPPPTENNEEKPAA